MPFLSRSYIAEDSPQRDGRRHIREVHVYNDGREEWATYTATDKQDVEAVLLQRAAFIEAREAALVVRQQEKEAARWTWVEVDRGSGTVFDAQGVARAKDITEADAADLIAAVETRRG